MNDSTGETNNGNWQAGTSASSDSDQASGSGWTGTHTAIIAGNHTYTITWSAAGNIASWDLPNFTGWVTCNDTPAEPEPAIESAGIRAGEIVAYRCWRIEFGKLISMHMGHDWIKGGQPQAQGWGSDHPSVGFHAWKTWQDAKIYGRVHSWTDIVVVGSVHLWGEVIEHEDGFRAEYAAIKSIDKVYGAGFFDKISILKQLRRHYGV